jgi:hypothetical protein
MPASSDSALRAPSRSTRRTSSGQNEPTSSRRQARRLRSPCHGQPAHDGPDERSHVNVCAVGWVVRFDCTREGGRSPSPLHLKVADRRPTPAAPSGSSSKERLTIERRPAGERGYEGTARCERARRGCARSVAQRRRASDRRHAGYSAAHAARARARRTATLRPRSTRAASRRSSRPAASRRNHRLTAGRSPERVPDARARARDRRGPGATLRRRPSPTFVRAILRVVPHFRRAIDCRARGDAFAGGRRISPALPLTRIRRRPDTPVDRSRDVSVALTAPDCTFCRTLALGYAVGGMERHNPPRLSVQRDLLDDFASAVA